MPKSRHLWFKFYPGDWLGDNKLQACSFEAIGLWANLVAVMAQDGVPYGHLSLDGGTMSGEMMTVVVRKPEEEWREPLQELIDQDVLSQTDDGIIYSRRLVRDHKVSLQKQKWGRQGGNPALKKPQPQPEDKVEDKPAPAKKAKPRSDSDSGSNSSSDSVSEKKPPPRKPPQSNPNAPDAKPDPDAPVFWGDSIRGLWNDWRNDPQRQWGNDPTTAPSGQGMRNLKNLAKEGWSPESLETAARRYLSTKEDLQNPEFLKNFSNFWGKDRYFEEFARADWRPPKKALAERPLNDPERVYD